MMKSEDPGIEMTPELVALAHRAVACKGWRWIPGMLVDGNRVLSVSYTNPPYDYAAPYSYVSCMGGPVSLLELDRELPDLTDPATLGCLLALVRAAHKCPQAHVYWAAVTRLWVVRWGAVGLGEHTVDAHTEVEALVRALEAANELP